MSANINKHKRTFRAQALVEFALALPIVLILIIGMFEVGRLIAYYSAVNSAAREASRYGAASGTVGGVPRYCDTAGIRAAAVNAGFFAGVQPTSANVIVEYDDGIDGSGNRINVVGEGQGPCASGAKPKQGQRIYITVQITYVPTVNFPSSNAGRTVRATAARTIMSEIFMPDTVATKQQNDPNNSFPPTPTRTPTRTATPGSGGPNTNTPTATVTATGTLATPTATLPAGSTPVVIIPTPILVVPTCTLGHTDLVMSSATVGTWNLINYYNSTVTITKIEVFSSISGQQVTAIGFGGANIFAGSLGTPALVKSGWAGASTDRQLASGQTKVMNLTLSKGDMIGSLQIKVTFDIGGCTVLDSSLSQP